MMKKLFLLPLVALSLTGCNRQLVDLELDKFDKAHLVSEHKCVTIKQWNNYEDEDMVQIKLKDDSIVLGHSNEIILVKGTCPYCGM